MKKIITIILILITTNVIGQKISPYHYDVIDTLHQYSNVKVIVYKDKKGDFKRDTLPANKPIRANTAEEYNIYDRKLKIHK